MKQSPSALALTPLLLFIALFFGAGVYYTAQGQAMGFYQLRAPVAVLPALALAVWIARRRGVEAGQTMLRGMGDPNIMLMCLIFLLAGAFAALSKAIGAVDAVVALGLGALPPALLLPGLFVVAGFIALAIGTSMGTIAALVPVAVGLATATGMSPALVVGAVIGGAMFGDNLSIISDTTIAATRTQGAAMGDKFRENFRIALPAALLTALLLALAGSGEALPEAVSETAAQAPSAWLVLPYLLVLGLALLGIDVRVVLAAGIVLAAAFGLLLTNGFGFDALVGEIWNGFESMAEITFLSLLIGGLAALMKDSGGLAWLGQVIAGFARGHRGQRSGEVSIGALAAGADLFTANNTVAILVSGEVARDIAARHGISPRRAASVLDIFACVMQGVIPWGAQILLAASLAGLSPLLLAGQVWYCWLLAAVAIAFILLWPRRGMAAGMDASSA